MPNFVLQGPDAFFFEVDPLTGVITPKDWFLADYDDAWDTDEDNNYEVTLVDTLSEDPTTASVNLEYRVTPVQAVWTNADEGPVTSEFSLTGSDTVMFEIDTYTGEITMKDWFVPDPDDNWDVNEDGVYEFTVVETAPDGTVTETLSSLTVNSDGTLVWNVPEVVELEEPQDPTVAQETDLLVNGLLDSGQFEGSTNVNADVDGWSNQAGGVESWGDGYGGMNSQDGSNMVSLDSTTGEQIDTLSQSMRTLDDDDMQLTFSAAQSGSVAESIAVYWAGELVDTVTPALGTEWTTYTFTVTGTGGIDTLEFRELASENDGSGPLIDNVSVVTYSDDAASLELLPDLTDDMLESPDLPTRPVPEPEPEGIPGLVLNGTEAGETLTGTADDDTINGAGGDDVYNGEAGNDLLVESAGADTLNGGTGRDTFDIQNSGTTGISYGIDLEAGHDQINTLNSIENVLGGDGNDTISGTSGDNLLSGGDGNDILTGRAGEDVLLGGLGDDTHIGGEGDDILIANQGVNVFDGGAGDDAIIINSSVVQDQDFHINLQTGSDQYGNTYSGIENIDGGAGDDSLTGDDAANVLIGRAGDDTLIGGLGGDVLNGGAGNDVHTAGEGDDLLIANAGNNHYSGGAGIDTYDIDVSDVYETSFDVNLETGQSQFSTFEGIENVIGGWGDDTLRGDAEDNILDGGVGADILIGGAGNDSIAGGLGDDFLDGGDGNDVLFGSFGVDNYNGGRGIDTVDIGGSDAGAADYNIDLVVGRDQYGNGYENIENISSGNGDDNLFGNADNNELQGNDGDDTINGGGGDDFHNGGNGNDVFIANEGANSYFGGNGIDTYQIENSTMDGVDFDINLEEGIDNQGNTSFGVENVNAGSGDDRIFGGAVDNELNGGGGDDTLLGGGGDDTLTGGEGNDVFGVEALAGNVQITDFTKGADLIDVSGIEGVEDFDDLAAFLLTGGGNSMLTFDLEDEEELRLSIEGEEELDATDFFFSDV